MEDNFFALILFKPVQVGVSKLLACKDILIDTAWETMIQQILGTESCVSIPSQTGNVIKCFDQPQGGI
jgi:hypothetical protein